MTTENHDIQRSFYESGYAGSFEVRALVGDFDRMSDDTRTRRILAHLAGKSGHLLDVGCGSGPLLYHARSQFGQLTGLDIAEVQLARARAWAAELGCSLALHQCNVDTAPIPLADASVDAAVCAATLEFVVRPDHVVAEMARVLKPGGRFVCSVGNIDSLRNRLRAAAGLIPETTRFKHGVNGGALHTFTHTTLAGLIAKAGLVVDHVGCSGRLWAVRSRWPALLGSDIIVQAGKPLR